MFFVVFSNVWKFRNFFIMALGAIIAITSGASPLIAPLLLRMSLSSLN